MSVPLSKHYLTHPLWTQANKHRLEQLIQEKGIDSPDYDQSTPPYVVVDWDNTSIIGDIQEAVLTYQLYHLRFALTPEAFADLLLYKVPAPSSRIVALAEDIADSYQWLYQHYDGFEGKRSLDGIQQTLHHQAFISKMLKLLERLAKDYDYGVHIRWNLQFVAGMTPETVKQLTHDTLQWALAQPTKSLALTSPEELPGKAGVIAVPHTMGLRVNPAMQELYQQLMANGFHLYVCSASLSDCVSVFASDPAYGYYIPEERVFAIELLTDSEGKLQPDTNPNIPETYCAGKSACIRRNMVSRYGYEPVMVAGDSVGDLDMIRDFSGMTTGLIMNGKASPLFQALTFNNKIPLSHYQIF